MKIKPNQGILLFVFISIFFVAASPAVPESTGNLIVDISGFPSSEGFAMVALHNSEASYQDGEVSAFGKIQIKLVEKKVQVVFTNLAFGGYGVSLFHDENANGKMDKNAMGIPKEAYGFSNNAKGLFGKPSYQKVMFQLNSAETQIAIKLD